MFRLKLILLCLIGLVNVLVILKTLLDLEVKPRIKSLVYFDQSIAMSILKID